MRNAAALDPDVAKVWTDLEAQRYAGQRRFTDMLASRGALRGDIDADTAADVLFVLTALAVHDMLVLERGWSRERYGSWLGRSLIQGLLPG